MDFILGLFTGYMLNWTALMVVLAVTLLCEANESSKLALFFGGIAAVIAVMFFQIPLETVGYGAVAYALIGICWSVWRYKRYVDKQLAHIATLSHVDKAACATRMHPSRMTGRIVHWMVIWPVSMVRNVTGDLLALASTMVTTWLKAIYESIYNRALSGANLKGPDEEL